MQPFNSNEQSSNLFFSEVLFSSFSSFPSLSFYFILCKKRRYMVQQYTLNVWSHGKQLLLFFRESWCFPRRSRGKHQNSRENKTNQFPEGPCIKCFVIYLDFHMAKTNKQRQRVGNNCAVVSRSGYIWIWSGAHDQESTNCSAQFV